MLSGILRCLMEGGGEWRIRSLGIVGVYQNLKNGFVTIWVLSFK